MRTGARTAERFSITNWTDPSFSSLRVVVCHGVRAQSKASGTAQAHRQVSCGHAEVRLAVPRTEDTNKDRGLNRRRLGIE